MASTEASVDMEVATMTAEMIVRRGNGGIAARERAWGEEPRRGGGRRGPSAADVVALRGSFPSDPAVAREGARRLWELLQSSELVRALGALSGGQAVQMAKAGLGAIYLSGWQVAADANSAGQVYPDQSL